MTRGAQGEESRYHTSHLTARVWSAILAVALLAVTVVPSVSAMAVPTPITSALLEPSCFQGLSDGQYISIVPLVVYNVNGVGFGSSIKYVLQEITFVSSEPLSVCFTYGRCYGTVNFSVQSVNVYDLESGNLLSSGVQFPDVWNVPGRVPGYPYEWYLHPQAQWTVVNDFAQYVVNPASWVTSTYTFSEPFVTWGTSVPDQVQYRSSLPTPQWDIHNRYIVIDDKLYWISYYIDNLWINPITGTSTVSSDDHTAVVTGNASDPIDGDIYYNYNISIRYQDKDYYCLQYNSVNYSNESMCAPCLVYNSSGSRLTISFDQLSGIYSSISDILVDYRIYCSSFDLITGEYIESVYAAQGQQGNAEININIGCPSEISSVYCYGVDFVNSQNLPVNLASIVWNYDFEFATWRSEISSQLQAIYNLLSQSDTPTTSQVRDYGSAISEVSGLPTYDSSDIADVLGSAVSDVNSNLSSGIEWGQGWFTRIYNDIPELFIVVVLALAFGLTLLILGKKKSDS